MYRQRDPFESYCYGFGEPRQTRLKRSQIDTPEGVLATRELVRMSYLYVKHGLSIIV